MEAIAASAEAWRCDASATPRSCIRVLTVSNGCVTARAATPETPPAIAVDEKKDDDDDDDDDAEAARDDVDASAASPPPREGGGSAPIASDVGRRRCGGLDEELRCRAQLFWITSADATTDDTTIRRER
eukprot:13011-Pelagococcus_subviridis.AAC.1